jgi:hypothetical protein
MIAAARRPGKPTMSKFLNLVSSVSAPWRLFMNSEQMVLGAIAGAAATWLLQKYGTSAVVASSLVGLLGAGLGTYLSDANLPAAVFAGSFVGMTAIAVAPLAVVAIAGAVTGALYALVSRFEVCTGYGGRLGTVAFISTSFILWMASALIKK